MITTSTGLRYEDVKEMGGPPIHVGQKILLHYRVAGSLEDLILCRNLLDCHEDHGGPIEVSVGAGELLRGVEEGLQGMQVGGKRRLIIPSDLAFGERGVPGIVAPDMTLFVEIYISTKTV